MSPPRPGPGGRPSTKAATGWRWLRSRPEVFVIAISLLCVIVALTMLRATAPSGPVGGVVDPLASDGPLAYVPGLPTGSAPDPLASEDALLAAASEASALASAAASAPQPALPPPLPSTVLAPESDSVFAAGAPEAPATQPAKRKPGPVLIFDAGAEEGGEAEDPAPPVTVAPQLRNVVKPALAASGAHSLTRGTTIPAVLESAIDSGQPGGVRAMVSTDVRSADGRRLLVPRSSRLVGQYRADQAKNRAYVIWTRLEKPDGSRIALNSVTGPAARFLESYAASSLVSQVSGAGAGTVRVRPGEPIRVIASRSVDLQPARR